MGRRKVNLPLLAMLFTIGVGNLVRFSHGVRSVAVVGLSGGGVACGVAMFGIIYSIASRRKG